MAGQHCAGDERHREAVLVPLEGGANEEHEGGLVRVRDRVRARTRARTRARARARVRARVRVRVGGLEHEGRLAGEGEVVGEAAQGGGVVVAAVA